MPKYILSPEAQQSLKGIHAYTIENFGQKQTIFYLEKLHDRMMQLAGNPASGKVRNDIKSGYYSYFEMSHTIYYRVRDDHIDVIDVLHQSQDPLRHII